MTGFARPELLASTEWLGDELGRPDVRIVDVRWRPDGTGHALFDSGHIPGATYLDWRAELKEILFTRGSIVKAGERGEKKAE